MLRSVLALVVLTATPALAASPEGLWTTPEENGRVEVRDCSAGICGFVVDGDHIRADPAVTDKQNHDPKLRTRRLKGVALFEGMTGGPKLWRGKVYNPVDGRTYSGSVEMIAPDRLKLQGCVFYPLCKTQVWKRAP